MEDAAAAAADVAVPDVAVPDCTPLSAFLSCRPLITSKIWKPSARCPTGLYTKFKKKKYKLNKMCI